MANYTKLKVIWKNNLYEIYKENSIIGVGQEAIINIDAKSITAIYVNFKVNDEIFTDLVEIKGNIINVPFKTDVLKIGEHKLEIVAYLSNGDVVPSPIFTYYVEESLANPNDLRAETKYPILIELLDDVFQALDEEEKRVENEANRIENEANRKSAETQRISEENERLRKEIERQNNEVIRTTNENNRITNELDRIENEENRKSNEIDRKAYEEIRIENEEERVEAENIRAEFYDGFNSELEGLHAKDEKLSEQLTHNTNTIKEYFSDDFKPDILGGNIWLASTTQKNTVNDRLLSMIGCGCKGVFVIAYHTMNGDTMTRDVSDEIIEYTITKAKDLGFNEIIIKPHIWSSGSIVPSDINTFMSAWKNTVMHYSYISENHNLDTIIIGNELTQISKDNKNKWVDIITSVKNIGLKAMYTFQKTDEFFTCVFKDNLDKIGVNEYPKIENGHELSMSECAKSFYKTESLKRLKEIKKYIGNKDLYLSEFGCTRNVDCMDNPAGWQFDTDVQSLENQYKYYKVAMSAFTEIDLFKSVYFWVADSEAINCFTPFGNANIEQLFKKYMGVE